MVVRSLVKMPKRLWTVLYHDLPKLRCGCGKGGGARGVEGGRYNNKLVSCINLFALQGLSVLTIMISFYSYYSDIQMFVYFRMTFEYLFNTYE